MLDLGAELAQLLQPGQTLELIGDVGAGKTTLVRGLARELGVQESITSPSFTISKQYAFPGDRYLVHYDFYRLPDPGIMQEDLLEHLQDPRTLTVIEWSDTVANLLPPDRLVLTITLNDDGTRTVQLNQPTPGVAA